MAAIDLQSHSALLLNNYYHYFGAELIEPRNHETEQLMAAPFAVLSHGSQEDPIFNYGNTTAQTLFEMDWATLTALPSRLSAEPMHREERQQLLNEVTTKGYSANYRGIRISASGRRFYIDSARIWTLRNLSGTQIGQAAMFSDWQWL